MLIVVTHPAICVFLDTIFKLQTTTYTKTRSIDECASKSRQDKEKEQFLMQFNSIVRGVYPEPITYVL